MYIYVYIYIYLNKCADSTWNSALTWTSALIWITSSQSHEGVFLAELNVPMSGTCDYRLQQFRTETASCAYSCWPVGCWPLMPPKKSKNDHWPMVLNVVRNGPEHPFTKESMVPVMVSNGPNTYPNINTYPLIYRQFDLSRSISTVEHGRIRSILTVDTDPPTENYGLSLIVDKQSRSVVVVIFCGDAATQLALQLHQERTQVVCGREEARNLWSILSTTLFFVVLLSHS